jgi:hypothetical protein
MRIFAPTVVFVSVMAASGQGPKNGPTPDLSIIPAITIHRSHISFSRALGDLGGKVGIDIALAPDVADVHLNELLYVNAAFEDVFVRIVHGQCLDYKITGPRSIVVTRSHSGGRSKASGPRAITWPDCAAGYVAPAPPEITSNGLQRP